MKNLLYEENTTQINVKIDVQVILYSGVFT